jgi:dTDP-4-amino-4,6-dideoxygalactose transaminase
MNVPFGDLTREVKPLRTAIDEALGRVVDSGWFILGPEVEAFENEFSAWLEIPHAVGVASGTEAITLALMALGVGKDDEVITVANTCVPTAVGIAGSGATVRLADCDPYTLMLMPDAVEEAITSRTRAIVPVHLYGGGADMVRLREIADHHGLLIVEDCAQSAGTQINEKSAGWYGDAAAFSFYPTKNLGAYGDGGCVVTGNPEVAENLRAIRNYGYEQRDYSVRLGLNSRLDPMQAAILRIKLPQVNEWNRQRSAIALRYTNEFSVQHIGMPLTPEYIQNCNHLFPLLVEDRDEVRQQLQQEGVQTQVHYPTPLHLQPALADLGYKLGDFPNAEWACNHVLTLPMFPQLADQEVDWVVDAVIKTLSGSKPAGALKAHG